MTHQSGSHARRYLSTIAIFGVMAAAALACSATTTNGSNQGATGNGPAGTEAPKLPVPGGRLIFGVAGENDGFLPQGSHFGPSAIVVARAIFDPLVVLGVDGNSHPYLATGIYPSKPDFTEWEIKGRPEALFHNGEKFDADAILANLKLFKASPLTNGAMGPIIADGIVKTDSNTVRISMSSPWANFPTLFTSQVGFFAAPAQLKAPAPESGNKPIGTGPFKFTSWTPGTALRAAKNETYWQKGLPYLDAVEFRPIQDADARRAALEAGDIDIAHTNATSELLRDIKNNDPPKGSTVMLDNSEGDEYIVTLNTQTGLLSDLNLRIALAKATDKEAMVTTQLEGFYETADGPYAKASPWWSDAGAYPFDLPGATKLVNEYKAANGGKAPKFTYTTIATNEDRATAQILQQQWQAAGFVVDLASEEEAKFTSTIISGKAAAFAFKFFNNPDPDGDYHFWAAESVGEAGGISINFPRYSSEVTQQALTAGRQNIDPAIRKAAYAKLWQDWGKNVPYIFVFHAKWAIVYNNRVHGVGKATAPDGKTVAPIVWGTVFLTETWIDQKA